MKWTTVESEFGYWTFKHNTKRKNCFYQIQYNEKKGKYRLKTSGFRAKEHHLYGVMLKRLVDFNTDYENPYNEEVETVVVDHFPLDTDKKKIQTLESKEGELIKVINAYKEHLKDVEVFEQKNNILITSQGYYIALYK